MLPPLPLPSEDYQLSKELTCLPAIRSLTCPQSPQALSARAGHCSSKQLEQSCTPSSSCRSCRTDLPLATVPVTNSDEQTRTVLPAWGCLGDSPVPAAPSPAGGTCGLASPIRCSQGVQTGLPGWGSHAAGLSKSFPAGASSAPFQLHRATNKVPAEHCPSPTGKLRWMLCFPQLYRATL